MGVIKRVAGSVLVAIGVVALTAGSAGAGSPLRQEATRNVEFRVRGDLASISVAAVKTDFCVSLFPENFVIDPGGFGTRVSVNHTGGDRCEPDVTWLLTTRPKLASDRPEIAEVRLRYGLNRGNEVTFPRYSRDLRLDWRPQGQDDLTIEITGK